MTRTVDPERLAKVRHVDDLPLCLTVPEVAAVLRCSVTHARNLIRTGRLPRLNTGGVVLVARRTLTTFLDTPTTPETTT